MEIPITKFNCLILGPGTSITHRAISNIASAGCCVAWMGSYLNNFYAYGTPMGQSSARLLKQIQCHESKLKHLQIVRHLYAIRYPSEKIKFKTLDELKGIEGLKVKECYNRYAQIYNIPWSGRSYDKNNFESSDVVNQYITAINQLLYAIVQAVIVFLGFSPAIGFIHTGNMQSFTYDIADLYKERYTIPLSFNLSTEGYFDREKMQLEFRNLVSQNKLMKNITNDILSLFEDTGYAVDDVTLNLWDYNSLVKSGCNYSSMS